MKVFGNTVYVNPDNTVLVQLEKQRLRKRLHQLRTGTEDPGGSSYIRSGVLFSKGVEMDHVDTTRQLF